MRLAANAFVFYGTLYSLYNGDRHEWMGALALVLATAYAAVARLELALYRRDRRILLVTLGTALAFVTLAIPIQLESNWITIAWALEALAILWAGFEAGADRLRDTAIVVFALAVGRLVFWDTPWRYRPTFTPVFNRYFLRLGVLRKLGLALFGLTIVKVVTIDISELRQFYRILALLALGLLLLWAAWAYNRFVLDLETLDKSRTDHADLRLYDAAGREIPYALRIRREIQTTEAFQAREFDRGTEGVVFRFSSMGRTAEQKGVAYPVSRYRYLRIRAPTAGRPRRIASTSAAESRSSDWLCQSAARR